MRTLVILVAVFEAVAVATAVGYLLVRRGRHRTSSGAPSGARPQSERTSFSYLDRAEDLLNSWLPRPAARLIMLEPRMWGCLYRWVTRRRFHHGHGFSYHRRSPLGAVVLVVLFTTPVELLLFELLIPVWWIRLVLLISAVYAVFWLVAYRAATIVLPHDVTDDGVYIRWGLSAEVWVPFGRISDMRLERIAGARGSLGIPREGASAQGGEAAFVVGGRSDLTLELGYDVPVLFLLRDRQTRSVRVAVDEPEKMLEAIAVGMGRVQGTDLRPSGAGSDPEGE